MIELCLLTGYLRNIHRIILVFLAVLLAVKGDDCPNGWVLWPEEQMCYYSSPIDDLKSFPDALAACEALNSTLFSQKDEAEKVFTDANFRSCGGSCPSSEAYEFWLGLVKPDAAREQSITLRRSDWSWLDGSPFDESWSNWDNQAVLEENMEPNNGDKQARLTFRGMWADKDAPYRCRYICKTGVNFTLETQYPATSQKTPTPPKTVPTSRLFTRKTTGSGGTQSNSDPSGPGTSSKLAVTPSTARTTQDPSTRSSPGKAKMTTQEVGEPVNAEEPKGKSVGLYVGVSLAALFVVAVTAFIIVGLGKLKKRREEDYSNSIDDIENDKKHMKEKPKTKHGTSMMPKYGDTWTSIGNSPNPYITNF